MAGCATNSWEPLPMNTRVDLNKRNYKVINANVIGEDGGFWFLILPITSPSTINALDDLYKKAGITMGGTIALANAYQEYSKTTLLLVTFTKMRVRADIIEFNAEEDRQSHGGK